MIAAAPALEHRNFRLFLGTQAISLVGTWMQNLGQAWLVLVLTRDPFVLGLVTAAQGLPIIAVGLLGGVVADRAPKRRTLVITQSTMLILALVLGALSLTDTIAVWHVVLLALGLGIVNAIDLPARQAFVVEMVGRDDVASAVGLNSSVYNAGRLVGPAVAGVAIAAFTAALGNPILGVGAAFVANALSYAVVVVGLMMMRESELHAGPRIVAARTARAVAQQIGEGLRYIRGSTPIWVTIVVPGLIATIAVNFIVLVPVLAQDMGMGAGGFGFLMAAVGLGALVSSLGIGLGGRAGNGALIGGAVALGIAEIAVGLTSMPLIAAALLFVAGAGAVAMRTAANTIVQVATPSDLRGRVMSVFSIVFEGSSPLGGLIVGAIASGLSGRAAFLVGGSVALLLAGVGARLLVAPPVGESVIRP